MRRIYVAIGLLFFSIFLIACTGAQTVTIIFETNGGESIDNLEVSLSSTEFVLPTPVKEGFTFDGWYVDENLTNPFSLASILSSTTITVYAKWIDDTGSITITFESNGGSAVSPITALAGATITAPTAPTKANFTFAGWYSDQALTQAYTFTVMPASNLTLYAKWTAVVVNTTITFEENGGSVVADITQAPGSNVTAPANPTKANFTFAGWFTDQALTQAYTFSTMPSTNITLYAKWTAVIVNTTITFEENGGTAVTDITALPGSTVTQPANPTKLGYTFAGWFSNSELTTAYTFGTMPTANLTLYAKWTVNSYTLTFNTNGGTTIANITQNYNTAITQPANPTKTGNTFAGWYSDQSLTTPYTFGTMPASNMTIYAKWTVNSYTISFVTNGGSAVPNITQNYNTTVNQPANPTKLGYVFVGWYSNAELTTSYTFGTMPASNLTLYARWIISNYSLTYVENGGSDVPDMLQVNYNTPLTPPEDPTREGYTFNGWYADETLTTLYVFTTMPASNLTLYAGWTLITYQLSFYVNGDLYEQFTLPENELIPVVTDPLMDGYNFAGWYQDELFIAYFDDDTMPDHDLTLYAKFVPASYTVVFMNELETYLSYELYTNQRIYIPEMNPEKTDWIFVGWYYDETFLTPYQDGDLMPADDVSFYAKFIEVPAYMPLELVISNKLTDTYHFSGIIYYVNVNQMDDPGFYLYDGTAYIFVYSYTSRVVGDAIEFDAKLDTNELYPRLVDVANISIYSGTVDLPAHQMMAFNDFMYLDQNDPLLLGLPISITGVLHEDEGMYYLNDLTMGVDDIIIDSRSITPELMIQAGQRITMRAIIRLFDQRDHRWSILYDPIESIGVVNLTNQEKLDALESFAIAAFSSMTFTSGEIFMFPPQDPVYGATLSIITTGENASYYDPITGQFGETDTELIIQATLTATLGSETRDILITFTLTPLVSMTVEEYLMIEPYTDGMVEVVVVAQVGGNKFILADVTGILLLVADNVSLNVGQRILIQGQLVDMDNMMIMYHNGDDHYVEVLEENAPHPIIPYDISVEQFAHLDLNDPNFLMMYFKVHGTLVYDDMLDTYKLVTGENEIALILVEYQYYEILDMFEGLDVSIRGYAIPEGYIEGQYSLIYVGDEVLLDVADDMLLAMLLDQLESYLGGMLYFPGSYVELPTEHPYFNVTVAYEVTGVNATLIDLVTGQISPDITEDIDIEVDVTATLGDYTLTRKIYLSVYVNAALSVSDFMILDDYDNPYFVHGIVVAIIQDQNLALIADANGIIGSPIGNMVMIGDDVLLFGYVQDGGGIRMIVNSPDQLLVQINASYQPNPLIRHEMTLAEFNLLDPTQFELQLIYVELTGTLTFDDMSQSYYISNETDDVPIFVVEPQTYAALNQFLGMDIIIRGWSLTNHAPVDPMMMLLYIDTGDSIMLNMTNEEFMLYLYDHLSYDLDQMIYRPDSYVYLPTSFPGFNVFVSYVPVGDNASLFNAMTGYISGSIEEETWIDIEVTITSEGLTPLTFTYTMVVEPLIAMTVTEFIEFADESSEYLVEGIVIYKQSMDETGMMTMYIVADEFSIMFVMLETDLAVGSHVQLLGFKVYQEGMLMIVNNPMDLLVGVISVGNENPLIPMPISLFDFLSLDPNNPINQFKYYQIVATLHVDPMGQMYYLSDMEDHQIPLMVMSYEAKTVLDSYLGQEVRIHVLAVLQGDSGYALIPVFLNAGGDIDVAYTIEEYVDLLAVQLPIDFGNKYVIPGQTYLLPTTSTYPGITFDYAVTDPTMYDLSSGLVSPMITFDSQIELTVTITGGANIQVVTCYLDVLIPTVVTLDQFLSGSPDVLYQVSGTIVLDMPNDHDGPQMMTDGLYRLFIVQKLDVSIGDAVVIVGFVNEFEGLTVLNADGRAMLVEITDSNVPNTMPIVPLTYNQFSLYDIANPALWGNYIELDGYLAFEFYADELYVYLYESFYSGAYIDVSYSFNADSQLAADLMSYDGLHVKIRGFVLPIYEDDFLVGYPMFFYTGYTGSLEDAYLTDQEKIDALVQLGEHYLENETYYALEMLELPPYFEALDISITWSLESGDPTVYDFMTQRFNMVSEEQWLTLRADMTLNGNPYVAYFDIVVYPVMMMSVMEFNELWFGDKGLTTGIIVAEIEGVGYILSDESGMMLLKDFTGLAVGNEIWVYGRHEMFDTTHGMMWDEDVYLEIVAPNNPLSPVVSPMWISTLASIDFWSYPPLIYTSLIGRLEAIENEELFVLTDGTTHIYIKPDTHDAYLILQPLVGQDIEIKGYTLGFMNHLYGDQWILLYDGQPGEVAIASIDDDMAVDFLYIQVLSDLDGIWYRGQMIDINLSHIYYGGTVVITPLGENAIFANMNGNQLEISGSTPVPCIIELEIVVTRGMSQYVGIYELMIHPDSGPIPFLPGQYGDLPTVSFVPVDGLFGGLYIHEISREYDSWSETTYNVVDLAFPYPSNFEATAYVLQGYNTGLGVWEDLVDPYDDLYLLEYDNYSLYDFSTDISLRLRTFDRAQGVIYSNEVYVELTTIDTNFNGWYLDESMYISGVMTPFVGHGLYAEAYVVDMNWDTILDPVFSYTWYRVNPYTFETTEIMGATGATYVTTDLDLGYYIMVKISGDQVNVGGYLQIISYQPVLFANPGFINDDTNTGFYLSFGYDVNMNDLLNYLVVKDDSWNDLPYNIYTTPDPAIYYIEADLMMTSGIYVSLDTPWWTLVSIDTFHGYMQGISYDL